MQEVARLGADLHFCNWHRWENRARILEPHRARGVSLIGVYCLATSRELGEDKAMEWQKVMYIGMSVRTDGLWKRWAEFDKALDGRTGHSAGNYLFGQPDIRLERGKGWRINGKPLFVSACITRLNLNDPFPVQARLKGKVAYQEYEAFARFSEHRSKLDMPHWNKGGVLRRVS